MKLKYIFVFIAAFLFVFVIYYGEAVAAALVTRLLGSGSMWGYTSWIMLPIIALAVALVLAAVMKRFFVGLAYKSFVRVWLTTYFLLMLPAMFYYLELLLMRAIILANMLHQATVAKILLAAVPFVERVFVPWNLAALVFAAYVLMVWAVRKDDLPGGHLSSANVV